MNTEIFKNPYNYKKTAEIIINGGLIAFPTETVYGLGADGFNEKAVKKIFEVKGRPNDNPLILHVSNLDELLELVVGGNAYIAPLYKAFMPGALTLVLPKAKCVPDCITAGLDTVAVRIPSHPIARAFIAECKTPIAAPSANISGRPSCTTFEHVFSDMNGKIEGIIDGGACNIGLESTILDLSVKTPTILRQGEITSEQLKEVIGSVDIVGATCSRPKAPGMKYRHYAPKAPLYLVDKINENEYPDKKIGKIYKSDNLEQYANELFDKLRNFDNQNVDLILVERVDNKGIGRAINNRLEKASENN